MTSRASRPWSLTVPPENGEDSLLMYCGLLVIKESDVEGSANSPQWEENMRKFVFCFAAIGLSVAAAHAEGLANLPEAIAVKGGAAVATAQASGAQIYACSKNAKGALEWTFREPVAALLQEGKTIGRHFVGPTWEFADGTHVVGKLVGKTPGKTAKDIPWLKLAVAEPAKSGPAAGATSILRIDTKGGAFEGACSTDGELHAERYAATYLFVK